MKFSIGKKLMLSGFVVIFFILLMLIANQVVVGLFKDTSTKLVIEYNELEAVEEFKFSLANLLISGSSYALYRSKDDKEYFEVLVYQARLKLEKCEEVITNRHSRDVLIDFEVLLTKVDSLAGEMFLTSEVDEGKINLLLKQINDEVEKGIRDVDSLLNQTKSEIDEYVEINSTVIKHSTITYLILGLIITLAIFIGGWLFIKSLTKPIHELVSTTNKISGGKRGAKVKIESRDEFQTLAESFNKMVDSLEESTVSKNYLNNILRNMFDTLIVTDQLKIRSINQSASKLLGFDESELVGKTVLTLFKNEKADSDKENNLVRDLKDAKAIINHQKFLIAKSGKKIPVLLSCTYLKDQENVNEGLIIVAHDLTEEIAIEEKLEHARKERLVAINEAQEEERIRIATDLHDGLGQMLTAISYSVQDLDSKQKDAQSPIGESTEKIQQQIDRAIREAKSIAHNLIPILLKDFGLIVAIENLIVKANELYSTRFRFDAFDFDERIDPKREKVLYRICQESMNNIVKHSKAKNASYQIFRQDDLVVLVIEDDGVGFNAKVSRFKEKDSGIGLISMRERVLAFEGDFTINSSPGEGTEIIIEIPCSKN